MSAKFLELPSEIVRGEFGLAKIDQSAHIIGSSGYAPETLIGIAKAFIPADSAHPYELVRIELDRSPMPVSLAAEIAKQRDTFFANFNKKGKLVPLISCHAAWHEQPRQLPCPLCKQVNPESRLLWSGTESKFYTEHKINKTELTAGTYTVEFSGSFVINLNDVIELEFNQFKSKGRGNLYIVTHIGKVRHSSSQTVTKVVFSKVEFHEDTDESREDFLSNLDHIIENMRPTKKSKSMVRATGQWKIQ